MSENFYESFDARDWAKAFVAHVTENPSIATDEGTMLSWFASALMRGHDERARLYPTAPLVRAVAAYDLKLVPPTQAVDDIYSAALALARPHIDPDGYRREALA